MKCFRCINVTCHTEYPPNSIVSVCPRCQWRSKEQQLPSKIPPVQGVSLVNQPKSNIFDDIYINNEVRVDSMSQILEGMQCVCGDWMDKIGPTCNIPPITRWSCESCGRYHDMEMVGELK